MNEIDRQTQAGQIPSRQSAPARRGPEDQEITQPLPLLDPAEGETLRASGQQLAPQAQQEQAASQSRRVRRTSKQPEGVFSLAAFCACLVASAFLAGGLSLLGPFLSLAGLTSYSTAGQALGLAFSPEGRQLALPYLISRGLLTILAFLLAGYTAGRMAGRKPAQSSLGILAWSGLGILLASGLTWAFRQHAHPFAPSFALQAQLSSDLPGGLLALCASALLAFLGSLLGALIGIRYYRHLS
ncbi:MAG: hypothetical protein SOR40_07830 [Rothia sp. (in: high G+C Gram-positive bacteria)]|nr:hypothetical protein [Rothia sp. (in: high G+C Gram-positive bacteria)]